MDTSYTKQETRFYDPYHIPEHPLDREQRFLEMQTKYATRTREETDPKRLEEPSELPKNSNN